MDAEKIYQQIEALAGKPSKSRKNSFVWVPAVANGGLKMLIEELSARGWEITPPAE